MGVAARSVLVCGLVVGACGGNQERGAEAPLSPNGAVTESSTAALPATRTEGSPSPRGEPAAPVLATDAPIARDPARAPREASLLAIEIEGLERLLGTVTTNAPDRAAVMRRLGTSYVELTEAKAAAGAAEDPELTRKAVALLTTFGHDYPNDPASDEMLYALGKLYERRGDLGNARKTYFDLIRTRPDSGYMPNAYAAFADMFLGEAPSDPSKLSLASQAYMEALKYPPPTNAVYGYAWYKLGQTYAQKSDDAKAMNAFGRAIDYGTQYSTLPGATRIADAARDDLVFVYAKAGKPEAAYNYFRRVAADDTRTIGLVFKLGGAYYDNGKYADALRIFDDLMARDPTGSCRHRMMRDAAVAAQLPGAERSTSSKLAKSLKAHCP
jgi:tetratricopeptide (TPR) repeat protein